MKSPVQNTEDLAMLLSSHISGRKECKGKEYFLNISSDGQVIFYPNVEIFPNHRHRKPEDKENVLRHVLFDHLPDILDREKSIQTSLFYVIPERVLPGNYLYVYSITKTKRRWSSST